MGLFRRLFDPKGYSMYEWLVLAYLVLVIIVGTFFL